MAAVPRPERKQAKSKSSGSSNRSRVKVYFDPSRVKPRQPVLPVIEGGTKTLTLQEQLGMAPSPPRPSKRRRTRQDEVMELVAQIRASREEDGGEKEASPAE